MRDIAQRNLATLRFFHLFIPNSADDSYFKGSSKRQLILNPLIYDACESLIETLKGRDEYIQKLMQLIEERFEKVWKLPWGLAGIIHGYLWDREDLLNISAKVKEICFLASFCNFLFTIKLKHRR